MGIMQILTVNDEPQLVTDYQCTMIYLAGKPVGDMHAGHIKLIQDAKAVHPTNKLVVRLSTNLGTITGQAQWHQARIDPDTLGPIQNVGSISSPSGESANVADMANYLEPLGVDYVVDLTFQDGLLASEYKLRNLGVFPAGYFTGYDFESLEQQAEDYMREWEFDKGRSIYLNNVIFGKVMLALMPNRPPQYQCRVQSKRELYGVLAHEFLETQHPTHNELVTVEPLFNSELNIPYYGRVDKLDLTPQAKGRMRADMVKWWAGETEATYTLAPKFLGGRIYKELHYTIPGSGGRMVILGRTV